MKILGRLLLFVCVVVFIGSGAYLYYEYSKDEEAQSDFDRLTQMVEQNKDKPSAAIPLSSGSEPEGDEEESAPTPMPVLATPEPLMQITLREVTVKSTPVPKDTAQVGSTEGAQPTISDGAVSADPVETVNAQQSGAPEGIPVDQTQSAPTDPGDPEQVSQPETQDPAMEQEDPASEQEPVQAQQPERDRNLELNELALLVRDFLDGNYAFENQPMSTIRIEVEPGDEPHARILIDGTAVFSANKQSQINQLVGQVKDMLADETRWSGRDNEIIDFDVQINQAPILPQYQELYEENNDMVGWIKIEGTKVNYPVMQTLDDPEFYLRTNFEKKESYSGLPFLDSRSDLTEKGLNLLIYGHNMKSGAMFGQLPNYESKGFWQKHPIIQFDTLTEERRYEIMAMFRSRQYNEDEDDIGFHYYEMIDLTEWSAFNSYVNQAKESSMIDTGVTASYGDEILTLSTCSYHTNAGTFVVIAKRIA